MAKTLTKGKTLHDRAVRVLIAKGYVFQDFGCWQYDDHKGMFMLSYSPESMLMTTSSDDGFRVSQEIEINSFAEFELLLNLIETFAFGVILPSSIFAPKALQAWDELQARSGMGGDRNG